MVRNIQVIVNNLNGIAVHHQETNTAFDTAIAFLADEQQVEVEFADSEIRLFSEDTTSGITFRMDPNGIHAFAKFYARLRVLLRWRSHCTPDGRFITSSSIFRIHSMIDYPLENRLKDSKRALNALFQAIDQLRIDRGWNQLAAAA